MRELGQCGHDVLTIELAFLRCKNSKTKSSNIMISDF